jgi:Mn2+/Fe2+ NRAMP family transporter
MAILIVGTQVVGEFSFKNLADTLSGNVGSWAASMFAFGLFAAGMTSSITSPLAAAVTAQSLFGEGTKIWSPHAKNFRLVWGSILFVGLFFGLTDIKPIPAIILAQAINGALLPIITIFLILVVNDEELLPIRYLNSGFSNIVMLLLVGLSCFLGINNILKAIAKSFPTNFLVLSDNTAWLIAGIAALAIIGALSRKIFFKK